MEKCVRLSDVEKLLESVQDTTGCPSFTVGTVHGFKSAIGCVKQLPTVEVAPECFDGVAKGEMDSTQKCKDVAVIKEHLKTQYESGEIHIRTVAEALWYECILGVDYMPSDEECLQWLGVELPDKFVGKSADTGWISVKDRLPEAGADVLLSCVRVKDGESRMLVGRLGEDGNWYNQYGMTIKRTTPYGAGERIGMEVQHWMAIPALPTKKE